MCENETGKPYFPPVGYLVIKPMSPALLRVVDEITVGSRLEGILYEGVAQPVTLMVRQVEETTAIWKSVKAHRQAETKAPTPNL